MRLDKWLWAARFFKTRSLCKSAIENGKIKINNERPKASRNINIGDIAIIKQKHMTITIEIIKLSEQRSSAAVAQTLYEETEDSITAREKEAQMNTILKAHHSNKHVKKPVKKTDRRALAKNKRNF